MKKKKRLGELKIEDFNGYIITCIEWNYIREVMTAKDYAKFCKWMNGQTCGVVNGESVVYPYDLNRFLKRLPVID